MRAPCGVLTTGPPGKSQVPFFFFKFPVLNKSSAHKDMQKIWLIIKKNKQIEEHGKERIYTAFSLSAL